MKKFLFALFVFCASCEGMENLGCSMISDYDRNTAQSYYDTFGTYKVSNENHNKIRKKFACYYRVGDEIYAYPTFWDTKYLLVRRGYAVTYVDGK